MKLKRITLSGFKSFADKTDFDFGDGVTVIVGPNGCGKSNVVDAVRWVLGAQSAKSLRGGQMLDVLFNGSNARKSSGMAEVTLAFENTRGLLPIDAEEVAVTRKLFRSGESAYLLNNQPCRLKDIRELFMDTGVGADAYSIIEQGKVETLLQTSKEDRRAVFEEAAGISRYKARKKEALRKLERTEQNVLRLNDIVTELEKQLRSIRLQAGKARNYQTHLTRLNELRMNQYLSEHFHLRNTAREAEANFTQLQDELSAVSTQCQKAQTQLSLLDEELARCDREIRAAETDLVQCTSQIGSAQDRIDLGHRRTRELSDRVTQNRGQIQSLREQLRAVEDELSSDEKQVEAIESQLTEQQAGLDGLQTQRQQRALALNELRRQLEDEKSGLIDIVRRTAGLHNEITSLDARHSNLSGQRDRLHDRRGRIHEEIQGLVSSRAELEQKAHRIAEHLGQCQDRLEQTRQQAAQVSKQRLECGETLASAKEHRSGLASRQQLLQDLETSLEGVDVGPRQVLQAKAESDENFYYIQGIVADLIQADVHYAAIIEAALASQAQRLVASSAGAVLADHEAIQQLSGRVQIVCLDLLASHGQEYDFSQHPEIQARLVDLVSYPEHCRPLAEHLLGHTLLVADIAAAVELAGKIPVPCRYVTPTGEVLEPDGTLHVGPPATGAGGLISRKSELRQLETSLQDADDRIRRLQHQLEQFDHQSQHLEKNLQDLRTAIYETRTEEVETSGHLERVDQNLDRLKREEPLLVSEIESLEREMQEALNQQASSQQSLANLESINQQRQGAIDELGGRIRTLAEEDSAVLEQITEVKVALGQTQQRRLALRERIHKAHAQLGQLQHHRKTLETDLANSRASLLDTQRTILQAESTLAELFHAREGHQQMARRLRYQQAGLLEQKDELRRQAHQHEQRREELGQKLHELQMSQNETRLRLENLAQRAREELHIEIEEAFESYEHQEMDWQAVRTEIEDLRGKIDRLGNINLDAITEQEELEQRHTALGEQLADLSSARSQLEKLIARINQESEELFRANFEAIRVNFAELFRKLFGGGRAEVMLEDPNNILECGIEIVARPPGKQLQSISLLSGGEKTMTAVALLMAIFKSKPSPFCLLDEVDAALDEANVERFTLVVREFLETSQFVVITHSRRTMAIADTIYGITMQEQGVSRKVAVRFAGEDQDDEGAAVA